MLLVRCGAPEAGLGERWAVRCQPVRSVVVTPTGMTTNSESENWTM